MQAPVLNYARDGSIDLSMRQMQHGQYDVVNQTSYQQRSNKLIRRRMRSLSPSAMILSDPSEPGYLLSLE
jgi:hypothetical protein